MKKIVSFILIILVSTTIYWLYQTEDQHPHFEDWAAQTASFFSSASDFLSNITIPSPTETDSVDEALEALLPSDTIDLRYQPDKNDIQPIAEFDKQLLPNLFEKKQDGPATKVSGQVHTDEDDKIIGAELQVAIPTN